MPLFLRVACLVVLTGFAQANESPEARPEPWGRICSFLEEDTGDVNPEFVEYLKSLTAEQMVLAARQACDEVARRSAEIKDMPPSCAAEIHVMACLHYYFARTDRDEGGTILLRVVSDRGELPFLRRALISRMHERDEPFDAEFQTYVSNNEAKVTAVLTNILKGRDDDPLVRREAMQCVGLRLGRQVSEIIRSDPHMRETLKEKRKCTSRVIRATELVRSGEVSLTKETLRALEPVEARTIAYVKLLGAVVADEQNEPEELRKQARRRLEGYRKSALTGIADNVEKALGAAGD